jgi:hypothetical protein
MRPELKGWRAFRAADRYAFGLKARWRKSTSPSSRPQNSAGIEAELRQ